jgi:hypothetical protein
VAGEYGERNGCTGAELLIHRTKLGEYGFGAEARLGIIRLVLPGFFLDLPPTEPPSVFSIHSLVGLGFSSIVVVVVIWAAAVVAVLG